MTRVPPCAATRCLTMASPSPVPAELPRARLVDSVEALGDAGKVRGRGCRRRCRPPRPPPGPRPPPPPPPPARLGGVYFTALSTRLMRIWARRSRSAWTAGRSAGSRASSRTPPASALARMMSSVPSTTSASATGPRLQRDPAQLDIGQIGEVVEQAAQSLGVPEHDLEKAPGMGGILHRPAEQGLQVSLDRGERRPELVRDIGHELGPDLLELAERGDVVEHHGHAGLAGAQAQRHGVDLQHALHRSGQTELAPDRRPLPRRLRSPPRAPRERRRGDRRCGSPPGTASAPGAPDPRLNMARARSFMSRMWSWPSTAITPSTMPSRMAVALACSWARSWIFSRSRAASTLSERPEGADLVRRAHGGAHREVALAELAGDGLHLDHRPRHPSRHEEADAERHRERHQPAHQHHPVDVLVARRSPRRAARPAAVRRRSGPRRARGGHVEQRRVQRGAGAQVAPDPTGERRAHLRAVARGSPCRRGPPAPRPDSATTRPSGRINGHAGARRARRPLGEGLAGGLPGRPAQQIARLVVEHAPDRHQPRLQRLAPRRPPARGSGRAPPRAPAMAVNPTRVSVSFSAMRRRRKRRSSRTLSRPGPAGSPRSSR